MRTGQSLQTDLYTNLSPRTPALDGQNRQSLAFSERNKLSQAIPQFHMERMVQRTPIHAIRTAMQRTQRLRGPNSVLLGGDMTANER